MTSEESAGDEGIFHWLTWSPFPGSPSDRCLQRYFRGALPGRAVHARVRAVLEDTARGLGLTPDSTLFGTSLCPDDINRVRGGLAESMKEYWGECFPLGGTCGVPFVGRTGFRAFANRVPDQGHILLLYGPHVSIAADGEVGKYQREGQADRSAACGAVIGAYQGIELLREAMELKRSLLEEDHIEAEAGGDRGFDEDDDDMEMTWIKKQIEPEMKRIQTAESPMAALAHHSYAMVEHQVDAVVDTSFGDGFLVLVGGIVLNMPRPCQDHFLPLRFEARKRGDATHDFMSQLKL